MDVQRLKDNFQHVGQHGEEVALFFYSDLFVRNPHLRDMFPIGMGGQRDKLLGALVRIVSQVDDLPNLVPFLQQLGRDHRKFSVVESHYPEVGASLIATLRYFSGTSWTPELEADWSAAYGLVAKTMVESANEEAPIQPAWWNAQVVAHERRRFDLAVFRVVCDQPLSYLPGQSVAVETRLRPRAWRYLSMANAPRPDNSIDFHVKLVDGGPVSSALVRDLQVGDWLRLGSPIGQLVLDQRSPRDILLVAGGTGLAPVKAILEQLGQRANPPRVHLFFGAPEVDALYDLEDLGKRATTMPWLTLVPVSEAADAGADGSWRPGQPPGVRQGLLPDVVAGYGNWHGHDAYVCGSAAMVEATVHRLWRLGVPQDRIRYETFLTGQLGNPLGNQGEVR